MTLTDKYPTLEQSKRIAELLGEGSPESERRYGLNTFMYTAEEAEAIMQADEEGRNIRVKAYDLAEMGEMYRVIANRYYIERFNYWWHSDRGCFVIGGSLTGNDADEERIFPTEAQARAALLIHLLEANKETK